MIIVTEKINRKINAWERVNEITNIKKESRKKWEEKTNDSNRERKNQYTRERNRKPVISDK